MTTPRPRRALSRRTTIAAGLAGSVVALSAVGAASTGAIPGDPLYGVKRATEAAQLRLAGTDAARGRLHLEFARHRLAELTQLAGGPGRQSNTLAAMDAETRAGARLLTGTAAKDRSTAPLDDVDRFVALQRPALAAVLPGLADATAREHAVSSLVLVERLRARSIALRSALLCTTSTGATDDLGPLPGACDRPAGGPAGPGSSSGGSPIPGGASGQAGQLPAVGSGDSSAGAGTAENSTSGTGHRASRDRTKTAAPAQPHGPSLVDAPRAVTGAVTGVVDQVLGTLDGIVGQDSGPVGGLLPTDESPAPLPVPTLPALRTGDVKPVGSLLSNPLG